MILNDLTCKDLIIEASDKDDPVCDLEFVGLRGKIITALEDSGIIYIKQLVVKTKQQIGKIKNIGPLFVDEIIQSLEKYNLLEDRKNSFITGTEKIQHYKKNNKFIIQ